MLYTLEMCESVNLTWIKGPVNASNINYRKIGGLCEGRENAGLRWYQVLKQPMDMRCLCGIHPPKPTIPQYNLTTSRLPGADPYLFKVPSLKRKRLCTNAKRKRHELKEGDQDEDMSKRSKREHATASSTLETANVQEAQEEDDCILLTDDDLYEEFELSATG